MPELTEAEMPALPWGCHERLLAHYGPGVSDWLVSVPEALVEAGRGWGLVPGNYHDAGHASVLMLATSPEGRKVLLKAWPDEDRCVRETTGLRRWPAVPATRVLRVDTRRSIAALSLVGTRPGGGGRPSDDAQRLADLIQAAHECGHGGEGAPGLPELASYLDGEVRPRIARRVEALDTGRSESSIAIAWRELGSLRQERGRRTLLHGDLYQENTVCDERGRPHLIDPLPMVGDAVFDWAFWIVYYVLGRGTGERLDLATRSSGIDVEELRSWCLALCLDGLLYYLEVDDARASTMSRVMAGFDRGRGAVG